MMRHASSKGVQCDGCGEIGKCRLPLGSALYCFECWRTHGGPEFEDALKARRAARPAVQGEMFQAIIIAVFLAAGCASTEPSAAKTTRYAFAYYDSVMVATAEEARSDSLWLEYQEEQYPDVFWR